MGLRLRSSSEALRQRAFEEFYLAYWNPLYVFARRCGHSPLDAEDFTQGFFAQLLRRKDLGSLVPEKGKLRMFLSPRSATTLPMKSGVKHDRSAAAGLKSSRWPSHPPGVRTCKHCAAKPPRKMRLTGSGRAPCCGGHTAHCAKNSGTAAGRRRFATSKFSWAPASPRPPTPKWPPNQVRPRTPSPPPFAGCARKSLTRWRPARTSRRNCATFCGCSVDRRRGEGPPKSLSSNMTKFFGSGSRMHLTF